MKKELSLHEFRKQLDDLGEYEVIFSSDNQPGFSPSAGIRFQLRFQRLVMSSNPNTICMIYEQPSKQSVLLRNIHSITYSMDYNAHCSLYTIICGTNHEKYSIVIKSL